MRIGDRFGAIAGILAATVMGMAAPTAVAPAKPVTSYPGGLWEPGLPRFAKLVVDHVKLAMNDGVVLDASVIYPADPETGRRAAGHFPVVIEDTPYTDETIPPTVGGGAANGYYATYGYISVRFHSRGTGASGGVHGFWSPREAKDGAAMVNWAAHDLDGSDGRVALVGCSFAGGHALGDAAAVGPGSPLKAVVAACIALDSINRHDILVSGVATQDLGFFYNAPARSMSASPATLAFYERFGGDILRGGDTAYARDFWNDRLSTSLAKKIVENDVPVLLWIGWQDPVGIGAQRTYSALQNAYARRSLYAPMGVGQQASPKYQLIVGDWKHAQGLDNGIILQWLETWVKGVDTGIGRTSTPMHLYEVQTKRWINASRFPMTDRYTAWHIAEGGTLQMSAGTGRGADRLVWGDPAAPDGTLTYTSPPLARGATIAGPIAATLYARSSNRNLQLIAMLYDVAPDGTAAKLTQGAMIGSLRELDPAKSWSDSTGKPVWPWQTLNNDSYLTAEQVYRFDIHLEPRQWGILPRHRVRLQLTTQPEAGSCPGPREKAPGNAPCYLTAVQKRTVPAAVYTLVYGPLTPSQIDLPQLPLGAFAEAACKVTPTSEGFCMPSDWGR